MTARKALFIVDLQNDFITGALAVPGAQEIIKPIETKIKRAYKDGWLIIYSRDWHPIDHSSFKVNGGIWPIHCVQYSWGSELPVSTQKMLSDYAAQVVFKGQEKDLEQYSAYTDIAEMILSKNNVDSIEVCGLARDYCVKSTVDDLRAFGYYVKVLEPLCRSVGK